MVAPVTIVAFDGKTLAADRAATNCGWSNTVTKIRRVPGGIVGFCGDGDGAMDLLAWFRGGRKGTGYPACQKSDNRASALFIDAEGRIWCYDKSVHPSLYEQPFYALGSGRDYALAAMHLGHDARKAVEVACALDNDCGNGIDVLELEIP
jgi:hypothetical protein